MAKTKYLYATKVQVYIMLISVFFVSAVMAYATFIDGSDPVPLPVLLFTVGLMVAISAFMWLSYKGKLPLMRIEER